MKNEITIYELLGIINDNPNKEIYIKYFHRLTGKEDIMWACLENIFDKLDNKHIFLNDKVKIIEEHKHTIEKLNDFIGATDNELMYNIREIKSKINEIIDYIQEKEND